ncbi:TULIP family P47-like protein [Altererythrobacter salegens]|uniref:TULIP family P47-like protein n=1 Tax=Croceibacterium salegens TaxID=1737568 RepID=A0A6I4T3G4_9SPHN|nr:TULIP family P47-like protein [Croceibacterium salegens]MXO61292.1 TULIP family P47-like protein [Croceibacterium salegens]
MSGATATADTKGWDIIFAFHVDEVNAAITAEGSSPQSFMQEDVEGNRVEGDFGPWTLVPGGAGQHVRLAIPLRQFVYTAKGKASFASIDGELAVTVALDITKDPEVRGRHHLVLAAAAAAGKQPDLEHVELTLPASSLQFADKLVCQTLLQAWLTEHLADFAHVFASIDLCRNASTGAFQWMQPTSVAFAYTDFENGKDGILALLAMTGNRQANGLSQQVSAACVPAGRKASLVISKERVMAEFVFPAMPVMFKGSKRGDFNLSGASVTKDNGRDVSFPVEHEGKKYQATLMKLQSHIDQTELSLETITDVWVLPGVTARTTSRSRLRMRLEHTNAGAQTLGFYDAPGSPESSHEIVKAFWVKVLDWVFPIVAAIVAIVLAFLSFGTATFVIGIIVAFALGADMIYEKANEGDAPAIGAAIMEATAAIHWPSRTGFRLEDAQLHGAMVLAGRFEART